MPLLAFSTLLAAAALDDALLLAGDGWNSAPVEVQRASTVAVAVPTVTAHGMGDSCFNSGMKEITSIIGSRFGTYAVCVPTGNRLTDTTNGFFMFTDPCGQGAQRRL